MNKNAIVGSVMAQVVKRLRKSGLPQDVIEKAVTAAKGGQSEGEIELGPRARAKLLALVRQVGPLVCTGHKALRVYTLKGYESHCKSASKSAKANKPWEKVGKGAVVSDKPKRIHWTQKPENRDKMLVHAKRMNDALKARKTVAA
jgi:hypothetical protein